MPAEEGRARPAQDEGEGHEQERERQDEQAGRLEPGAEAREERGVGAQGGARRDEAVLDRGEEHGADDPDADGGGGGGGGALLLRLLFGLSLANAKDPGHEGSGPERAEDGARHRHERRDPAALHSVDESTESP